MTDRIVHFQKEKNGLKQNKMKNLVVSNEPLRSFVPLHQVQETSLAVPSDDKLRTGQQRVMDQVYTMRRRSKSSMSGSGSLSPSSPVSFSFNKNISSKINLSSLTGSLKGMKVMGKQRISSTQYAKANHSFSTMDGRGTARNMMMKPTRSNPELAPPPQLVSPRYPPTRPILSQTTFTKAESNSKAKSSFKEENDMSVKDAVEFLTSPDEKFQLYGASFIQHNTYSDPKAKQEVLQLKGIPSLVSLLQSSCPPVQEAASSALRNLVFKDNANKLEVQRCGGIGKALALLKSTDSDETKKQLTGLLWNLSSSDDLKSDLIQTAMPVLTDTVVVPYAGMSEQNTSDNMDPEIFYNTTACLRNLSSDKQKNRQAMRNCRGLIDSLISYVQACADADRSDDKSVENCVCILHNLTYQLEKEAPGLFSKITALATPPARSTAQKNTSSVNCFSQQGSKTEQESYFDYPVMEDNNPKGAGRLFHSSTMQTYLNLLGSSQNESTLEACMGTLQNLTAQTGTVSNVMSQTIVQKLNGLQSFAPLLQSSNPKLQKTATALLGNLSRSPRIQSTLARHALPRLASVLTSGATDPANTDDTMMVACHTIRNLLKVEPEVGKKLLNNTLINSLVDLSKNRYFPNSSQAAGLLLHSLWAEKDTQSILKKQGMNKGSFINDITTLAFKSAAQSILT
ncbi:plakophilin-1-like isoform X1 [Paramormyrops kingsleyae]|uniref:Plakophilin 1 n=2 Tax=Paramormyrops kingsleyae TaxID=1676925 RepID=A0A3B3R7N4_9TELE|nr:plakophilin-1-like isoform X1 [Paramormyrops kingsleyae]